LAVTLLDVSEVGLALAATRAAAAGVTVDVVAVDLDDAPAPSGPFDVIVIVHFLHRGRRDEIAATLAPGGVLVAIQPTMTNLERHARPGPEHLVAEGELATWARAVGLEVEIVREGWNAEGRHETEMVARRPG
ncbi:MAG: methyltransferase domain-containing protein, partial [Myxococcales bacterium]|nr:methyltransferase domain-containing protein [Myxococcales bacterium]